MIYYSDHTLAQYLDELSGRQPVPGGGSAAAVSGAMGAALIAMSGRYALGKGKSAALEQEINAMINRVDGARLEFLALAGRDAEAYQNVLRTRKAGDKAAHAQALAAAGGIPCEVIALCEACLQQTPFLDREGNPLLRSDVKAAEALLRAGIEAARAMQEANA